MDLNFERRKREMAIAREVAEAFYRAVKSAIDAGVTDTNKLQAENRDALAHHFGMICQRHQLGEADAKRVFGYAPRAIAARQHEMDALDAKIVHVTESIIELQRTK